MMSKKVSLFIAVGVVLLLFVFLTSRVWNSSTANLKVEETHTHDSDSAVEQVDVKDLDQRAINAAMGIQNATSNEDVMKGVRELLDIVKTDSNHIGALEILAEMSVQSGQYEKAIERYQKLLSLQPENEDYQKRLSAILKEVGG
jgi:Tfp pilus assembly protein PilF